MACRRLEFQRLHGMGEPLYEAVRQRNDVRCRIYAPVGAHSDLLAYLVRRLLENGANSSFVNQIVDEEVPPESVARDPYAVLEDHGEEIANPAIPLPQGIIGAGTAQRARDGMSWPISQTSRRSMPRAAGSKTRNGGRGR